MADEHIEGISNMADVKVLALVGSLRAASINRQLAELAAETAPEGVAVTVFEGLGDLPFYNEDIDNENVPASVVGAARGRRRGRRRARRHAGVQRQHSRRDDERSVGLACRFAQRDDGREQSRCRCPRCRTAGGPRP